MNDMPILTIVTFRKNFVLFRVVLLPFINTSITDRIETKLIDIVLIVYEFYRVASDNVFGKSFSCGIQRKNISFFGRSRLCFGKATCGHLTMRSLCNGRTIIVEAVANATNSMWSIFFKEFSQATIQFCSVNSSKGCIAVPSNSISLDGKTILFDFSFKAIFTWNSCSSFFVLRKVLWTTIFPLSVSAWIRAIWKKCSRMAFRGWSSSAKWKGPLNIAIHALIHSRH